MAGELDGRKIAILVTDGFEEVELTAPKKALDEAGAVTDIVSPNKTTVKSWVTNNWGHDMKVDVNLSDADADNYDALLLPGGVMNPDKLRINEDAVEFVQSFVDLGKPIAAICHGPWTLIETGMVEGRQMTSWPSLRTDLENAGAEWVDEDCVVDNGLVTSRKPGDIPVFNKRMIEEFAEGIHSEFTETQNRYKIH